MPREGVTLPGYIGLTQAEIADAIDLSVSSVVKGTRISGPFLVRAEQAVTKIKDGWLCQDSNGRAFGIEDNRMGHELLVDVAVTRVPGSQCPKVGVAYSQSFDTFPHDVGNDPVSFVLAAGFESSLPEGLSMNSAGLIVGTPPGPSGQGSYYFEANVTFTDGEVARMKVAMAVFPA
jgi:hypothetical protein